MRQIHKLLGLFAIVSMITSCSVSQNGTTTQKKSKDGYNGEYHVFIPKDYEGNDHDAFDIEAEVEEEMTFVEPINEKEEQNKQEASQGILEANDLDQSVMSSKATKKMEKLSKRSSKLLSKKSPGNLGKLKMNPAMKMVEKQMIKRTGKGLEHMDGIEDSYSDDSSLRQILIIALIVLAVIIVLGSGLGGLISLLIWILVIVLLVYLIMMLLGMA